MRFNLNQKYPFIAFSFTYSNGNPGGLLGFNKPIPWRDTIHRVEVKELLCTEHHLVPDYWDSSDVPEKKNDGFIFKDEVTGRDWFNQFPRACYGQLSDKADGVVQLSALTKEEIDSEGFIFQMYSAFRFLDECVGEVHALNDSKHPDEAAKLQQHYEDIKAQVEKATGKKIISKPVVFTDIRTGDQESYDFIVRHSYE